MAISKENRAELRAAELERMAQAQAKCLEYNEAKDLGNQTAGYRPAPAMFQGFNRRQRRDGTAKRWLIAQAEKAAKKAEMRA